ncbi:OmpA family protein [Flavilitoribacter nigricans]|uniref:OmpA-like domain-containing protein n=1 Tax=Flavilitoribacter nigricans (strain ATCC 23147 / DSM 23189 / NBRC 102662 / NCIMB 1420 / SS-2) TaxID=1122177 RepID=A0A2D0N3A5_FLAN2|nr:OmpA family protein [Flavilitoribacter nigricans]PHN02985.1 hypothetical protein CRP01_29720 [Flavilitoribacter nigricans DSM 23189 = NBRC 102662]
MRKIIFLLVCVGLGLQLSGQEMQKEKVSSSAISAKLLFIDYGTPNDLDDLKVTNGLEIGFLYNFNRFIGIGVPLKVGVANVFEDINNRNIISVDGVLRLQYQAAEESPVIPYIFGGVGYVSEVSNQNNMQIPLGAGLNIRLGQNSYGNIQGEYRMSDLENRNNLQLGVGYVYKFGKMDRDRDGIADNEDDCPDIAGVASANGCPDADGDGIVDLQDHCPQVPGIPELSGCPDRDGDGVADDDDQCPDEPGTVDGCPDSDEDGVADKSDDCPEVPGVAELNGCPDRDGDGIKDAEDKCPDEAGTAATNGCPDRDGDGIIDAEDECPDEAGTARTRGCPDRDGDGVADADDRCPDVEGPYSGCPDTDGDGLMDADDSCPDTPGLITNKGCPEIAEEVKEVLEFAMRAVQFQTGKSTLLPASFQVLDQIVDIMGQYPDYSMSINGHTDSVGDESSNQLLSEERAKACYAYLISKGISPSRLSFQGFGESSPIADNNRSRGRMLNRRVEFNLYIP